MKKDTQKIEDLLKLTNIITEELIDRIMKSDISQELKDQSITKIRNDVEEIYKNAFAKLKQV